MANTTTGSLADSLDVVKDSARIIREYEGVFQRVCDNHKLEANTGLAWDEISLSQISAQTVTETTILENPQSMADTLFSITPLVSGINTIVTDRVYQRISKKTIALMGKLAQNAMQRKKDEDFLAVFAGATTTLSGTGTTLASGIISAAVARITGNATEGAPEDGNIFAVLHPFQIKDIQDEIVAGIGTYPIPHGMTADVFKQGMAGIDRVSGAAVFRDGNIVANSTPDARGGVFHKMAIVMVQGHDIRTVTRRREEIGGGADELFIYDEHALGERSAGNWLYGILSDATAPTA